MFTEMNSMSVITILMNKSHVFVNLLQHLSCMKSFIITILITCLLFIQSKSVQGQSTIGITIKKDMVYGHAGGEDQKLDIGTPEGKGPFPAILFFHGGGWQQGAKWHMHKWIQKFASSGYVGVSVEYRFAPHFKWPAQVQDAKQAVRYLRAHAAELNIDPNHIGAMGESAGAYLALMLGVTSPTDSLEGQSDIPEFSSSVQAVVSFFSGTDFTLPGLPLTPQQDSDMLKYYHKPLKEVRADFTGATGPDDPILKKISVLTYVDKNDPPILMFHGDSDPFVSLEHPRRLQQALEKVHVPNQLIIVKGGGHGWTGTMAEETTRQMSEFFERILKNK
jgi:acetyl esterase/lipase